MALPDGQPLTPPSAGDAPACQAPDPHPRPPLLKTPAGTTDTHLHVLGPAARFPYVPNRDYTPPDAEGAAAARLFAVLGIQRAVLVQPSVYGDDNRCMVDASTRLGVPTRMVVVVHDDTPDRELQRLHDAGARAVRFILAHPGGVPLEGLERTADRIREMGWHCQFLLRPPHLIELESRLSRLSTDFVIDHMGLIRVAEGGMAQPAVKALLRLVRGGRCLVKLTGGYRLSSEPPPYRDLIPLASALLEARPDRLLWGSDWPHVMVKGPMPNTTDMLDLLLEWIPDESHRNQILVVNPQVLFSF